MAEKDWYGRISEWYRRTLTRWIHFRSVPMRRLWVLIAAEFFLFSVGGFYVDLMYGGVLPYVVVLQIALYAGLSASLWILVLSRLSLPFLLGMFTLQFFNNQINNSLASWLTRSFDLKPVPSAVGVHFAATATLTVIILSYVFFFVYIRREGTVSSRMRNELELAHRIQKTLVPPVELRTSRFEIYGISHPSEKVGGDLVDTIHLPNGDAITYVADIAGHGLPAGILMGMLKTATRTALLEAEEREPHQTLPVLLDRLNRVLPEVKEPHMYATFTGFRLGADGSVFYALAASPPILQWHASRQTLSHTEESQFPLGLLPVSSFDGQRLEVASGDLLVVATDGILEVCDKPQEKNQEEFGVERLKQVIAANAKDPLPELAASILTAARGFGRQLDDQTILIVRCL
jgi:Stage II sporulation protein E (SpoIIE)